DHRAPLSASQRISVPQRQDSVNGFIVQLWTMKYFVDLRSLLREKRSSIVGSYADNARLCRARGLRGAVWFDGSGARETEGLHVWRLGHPQGHRPATFLWY